MRAAPSRTRSPPCRCAPRNSSRSRSPSWSRASTMRMTPRCESLNIIQSWRARPTRQNLAPLRGRVEEICRRTFAALTAEQDELGLTEFEGMQGKLRDGGNTMERIVNEDMSWLSEADQRKILVPLMLMRRFEVEYRLTRADPVRQLFKDELERFEKASAAIIARRGDEAAAQRSGEDLHRCVRRVDREHRQDRRAASRSSRPRRARCCPPPTRSSRRPGRSAAAAGGVAASQQQTKLLIIGDRHRGRLHRPRASTG